MFEKITVFKDNKIEVRWRVPCESGGRRFDFDKEWGGSRIQDQTNFPPAQLAEIIHFTVIPLYQNRDFLHEKYVVNGLSAEEIGLEIVSATSTILKHLKLLGIPIRGSGKNTRPKRQLAYGQKIVGRKVEVCKSEMAAIDKMNRLREKGFSYWKVADILNSMGGRPRPGRGLGRRGRCSRFWIAYSR